MIRISGRTLAVLLLGMVIGMIAACAAQDRSSGARAAPPGDESKAARDNQRAGQPIAVAQANAIALGQVGARGRKPNIVVIFGDLTRRLGKHLHFESRSLDLDQVAAECDVAVLHGTHGTTVSMLMAGKPTLQVPIFMEQALFAKAVAQLGAGLRADSSDPAQLANQVQRLLQDACFSTAARGFRERYVHHDPDTQLQAAVTRICHLLD